jgi:hypothetical protein
VLHPGCAHLVLRDLRCNWVMTQSTRIYRHSAAGTDWVAGQDGAKWFGQPELAGYQVFAVTRHEQSAWSI